MNPAPTSVDLSPISHRLESGAFDLFRSWTSRLPGRPEIHIRDETVLVEDVRKAFTSAILRLRDKPERKVEPAGWAVGFVAGMVAGKLEVHWHHEYIVRRSEAYQRYAALKALEAYLKFDELVRIRVERLYEHFLTHEANVENIPMEAIKQDLSREGNAPLTAVPTAEQGKVLALLNNILIDHLLKMARDDEPKVEIEVIDVFTWEGIAALVAANERD